MQEQEDRDPKELSSADHPIGETGICSGKTAKEENRAADEEGVSAGGTAGKSEAAASIIEELPGSSGIPAPADPEASEHDAAEPEALEAGAAERREGSPGKETAGIENSDAQVLAASRRYTRRSFAVAAAAVAAGYGLYHWVESSPADEMQPWPLRRAFQSNAAISRWVFRERALAPTYPLSRAQDLRVNGVYGLKMALDPESYRLQVVGVQDAPRRPQYSSDVTAWQYRYLDKKTMEDRGHDTKTPPRSAHTAAKMAPGSMMKQAEQRENRAGRMPRGREEAGESRSTLPVGTGGLLLTMDDIRRLPRRELITQFKCIEGWSEIVHWAGVRMADFLEEYPPEKYDGAEPRFVYMETPDGDYYTGYDMDICRHPQTLLVTEMMGAPLTQYHGAPLRLHMPTKYGYKQIKRIGLISYNRSRPDDYWTKLGYDWYAGL